MSKNISSPHDDEPHFWKPLRHTSLSAAAKDRHATLPVQEMCERFTQKLQAAFFSPGHKLGRSIEPQLAHSFTSYDLNNLPDTDTLHCPTGAFDKAEKLLAEAYGAESSFMLVQGSSLGNIASLVATTRPNDLVLVQRNCHKSTIAGLIHSGASPIWLNPEWDDDFGIAHGVSIAEVDRKLAQTPGARALTILNPTYFGASPDLHTIQSRCKQNEITLLVDEAHGAHFHFHDAFPVSAVEVQADLVVQSAHKTLSAFSQAAQLHTCSKRVPAHRIRSALNMLQTTSPHFAILASIDHARRQMILNGREMLDRALQIAMDFRLRCERLGLRILNRPAPEHGRGFFALDPLKITLDTRSLEMTGWEVQKRLSLEHGVHAELAGHHHVLFIMTVATNAADGDKLFHALNSLLVIAKTRAQGQAETGAERDFDDLIAAALAPKDAVLSPREAFFSDSLQIALKDCVGRIAAEIVTPYPPGIPLLMPGERITADAIGALEGARTRSLPVSCGDTSLQTLAIVKE